MHIKVHICHTRRLNFENWSSSFVPLILLFMVSSTGKRKSLNSHLSEMALPMTVTYSNPYLGTLISYLSYFYFTPFDVQKYGKSEEYILVRYKGKQVKNM